MWNLRFETGLRKAFNCVCWEVGALKNMGSLVGHGQPR